MSTILVVDDASTMVMSLKNPLEKPGFEVDAASDRQFARQRLRAGSRPDPIITHSFPPRTERVESIRHTRKSLRSTPIRALTSDREQVLRDGVKQPGATGWCLKSVPGTERVTVISQVLAGA